MLKVNDVVLRNSSSGNLNGEHPCVCSVDRLDDYRMNELWVGTVSLEHKLMFGVSD